MKKIIIFLLFVYAVSYAQFLPPTQFLSPDFMELPVKERQKQEIEYFYKHLLWQWKFVTSDACTTEFDRWRRSRFEVCVDWWKDQTPIVQGDRLIGSAVAVNIAFNTVRECYGHVIKTVTFGKPMLMGVNEEHWMVYVLRDTECHVNLRSLESAYQEGLLYFTLSMYFARLLFDIKGCFSPVGVLISRKTGQVLFIGTL